MMNQLKKVNAIQAIETSHLVKKVEIKKRIFDLDKYVFTTKFDDLTQRKICLKIKTSNFSKQN